MTIPEALASAKASGRAVRIERSDGEVVVLKVLALDSAELLYAVYTSTHPERYGVCDSTGFAMPLDEIQGAAVLERPPAIRRAVLD